MNLNPFSKKKKKLPFEFKALVFVPSVDSMQLQTAVESILYRDPKDQLLYIVDSETKGELFKELFPGENKKNFIQEEIDNLKIELAKKQAKIKTLDPKSKDNILNLKKEISQMNEILIKHNEPKGSFVIQSGTGEKSIYFLRKSTGNFPIHWDIHSNVAFSPTEKNSRDLFAAWKTKYENLKKDEKMPFEKITTVIAGIVLAVIIIVLGILTWNWLQYDLDNQKAMQTQAYICQQESLEAFSKMINTNQETSTMLNEFTENMLTGQGSNNPKINTDSIK